MRGGPPSESGSFAREVRIERAVVIARLGGVALLLTVAPFIPNIGLGAVYGFAAYLLGYDLALVVAARRGVRAETINLLGFSLDAIAVAMTLVVFAPQTTWDSALVIPAFLLTAAFRLGRNAAVFSMVGLSLVDVLVSLYRAELGIPFSFEALVLRIGLYGITTILVVAMLRQLNDLRTMQTKLFEPLLRAQDALGEAVIIRDGDRLTTISDAFVRLTGYERSELPDLEALMDLVPEEERGAVMERMAAATQDRFDMHLIRKDGRAIAVEVARKSLGDGDTGQTVVLVRDITERRRAQDELEQSVLRDPLTGLPNAAVLRDRIGVSIADARRQATSSAVLLIVLQGFQFVTETVGLTASNRILFELAGRLRERTREVDTVARFSGDSFGVLLTDSDEAGARRVATALADVLAEPYELGRLTTGPLDIRTSIGVALWPQHADTAESLLRCAEIAARHAVRDDEAFVVYRPGTHIRATEAFSTVAELRAAIRDGAIVLHYQPLIDLRDQRVVSLEGLARWQHPTRGVRSAEEFIPLAEEAGLMRQLTESVLARLGSDAAQLSAAPRTERLALSLNLSARNLRDADLERKVRNALRQNKIAPWRLSFEVTETAVMIDPEQSVRVLDQLRALGVRIVLDDFGTGHSSLSYLQRLPIQGLKIDRSFVAAMNSDRASATIVRATIDLAKRLDLQVVVEGVEDRRTLDAVRSFGADAAQGYVIARPMPLADVAGWLEEYERVLMVIDTGRFKASGS